MKDVADRSSKAVGARIISLVNDDDEAKKFKVDVVTALNFLDQHINDIENINDTVIDNNNLIIDEACEMVSHQQDGLLRLQK